MIRSSVLVGALLSIAALTAGCDKASDEVAKANRAQSEANVEITEAAVEAAAKAKSAQASADKGIAEAQASFMKLREDYRHATTNNLADLDKKIAELGAKAKAASGREKTDREKALNVIRTTRERFMTEFAALETSLASTWDRDKANLDKVSDDLKALVDGA